MRQLGDISLPRAIGYGLAISFTLVVTRLLCTLGASVFTRFMSHFITVAEANPGWRGPLVLGWAGMRGVVSLAAALSIPIVIAEGQPFPYRNLILFITFIVILVTLVFQGLTLPWVIRKIRPESRRAPIPTHEQEIIIQKKIAHGSLRFLEENYSEERSTNDHINILHEKLKIEQNFLKRELEELKEINSKENTLTNYQNVYLELLEQQRNLLKDLNRSEDFDEELIRKYFALIDLEEFKIREQLLQPGDNKA